jgi:hypothetical protein
VLDRETAHEIARPALDEPLDEEPHALELRLRVRDPELLEELSAYPGPRDREAFALEALRIGVLSLRTARGQIDAQTVRGEVERLLRELEKGLAQHQDTLQLQLGTALREYFDPRSGRFAERVEALVREDGELAGVIRRHVEGADSPLGRTLSGHLGAESPLMRALDPHNTEGLIPGIGQLVGDALASQRERILKEFSLDNREGSLARLVAELTQSHGKLTDALQERIEDVVREFSLDEEDSALSRLVQRVERAQQQITDEFTLDSETSALARLRRELLAISEKQSETIRNLEERVRTELAVLTAQRERDRRSPEHGHTFEAALLAELQRAAQEAGDVFHDTSNRTGQYRHRKVGDAVIELGPEHRAAGARIVVEAKEEAGYSLAQAREEIELARKNRQAEIGIFVFSARTAPAGQRRFERVGSDLFVVWDREESTSDVYLDAALSVARTLCVRRHAQHAADVDFGELDRALRDVEKQIEGLDEIRSSAETIESGSAKILKRVGLMRDRLGRAVETLDRCATAARLALGQ